MPLTAADLPLEVGDHVVLDREVTIPTEEGWCTVVLPKESHGMVTGLHEKPPKGLVVNILFGGTTLQFVHNGYAAMMDFLTLYRRSQDSRRRNEHDARRSRG
jgi:hypothetical protein